MLNNAGSHCTILNKPVLDERRIEASVIRVLRFRERLSDRLNIHRHGAHLTVHIYRRITRKRDTLCQ